MTGIYRLAELNIEICSLHSQVHTLCGSYQADPGSVPSFAVETVQSEIDFEREKVASANAGEGILSSQYTNEFLETVAVHRKIAERMPFFDVVLFHGSAVAVDGAAYVFAALSGTGKSTHARLWRELLGERAVMVNDDKPFLRVAEDGGGIVYGSPWDGKHRLSNNIEVPLRAVCLLERAPENRIERITKAEALPRLLLQVYRPYDPAAMEKTMTLLDRLDAAFYRLHCNMDLSAAELSYSVMRGG